MVFSRPRLKYSYFATYFRLKYFYDYSFKNHREHYFCLIFIFRSLSKITDLKKCKIEVMTLVSVLAVIPSKFLQNRLVSVPFLWHNKRETKFWKLDMRLQWSLSSITLLLTKVSDCFKIILKRRLNGNDLVRKLKFKTVSWHICLTLYSSAYHCRH